MISIELFEELYKNVDYSIIGQENIQLEEASGVKYVNMIVEKHLGKFSKEYFFEYSTIGSTINIDKNELYCFSAIKGSDYFKERLSKYAQTVINQVFNDVKYNWFHNPQLFIAPTISNIKPFINRKNINHTDLLQSGIDIDKIISDIDQKELSVKQNSHQISSDGNLYITDLRYKRSFDLLLESSKAIFERCNGSEVLLTSSYHDGAEMLRACYDKILNIQEKDNYYYVTFPIISSRNSKTSERYSTLYNKNEMSNRVQGTGHFFIYFKIDNFEEDEFRRSIDNLFCEINLVLNFLSLNYIFNSALDLYAQSQKEAVKSAKAAIMSRNMSHNLGSHVMAYLKQRLNSVEDIIKENSIASIIKNTKNSEKPYQVLDKLLKKIESGESIDPQEVELPFLVGLGKFINYIQERQDFIATIATNYIPYTSPVNFKDSIYDELNPDLRHLRHKERSGHKPDNILLAYIAKSEGLERENFDGTESEFFKDNNNIIIRFRDFIGLVAQKDKGSRLGSEKSLEQMKDFELALPGGSIGRQAFFSIIENIIRNAAKHGQRKQNENLEIALDILDISDEKQYSEFKDRYKSDKDFKLQLNLNDPLYESLKESLCKNNALEDVSQLNLSIIKLLETKYKTVSDIDDLYVITITDNIPIITDKREESEEKLLGLINAINKGFIDETTGEMDNSNKGLKEIRISGAWLRGIVDDNMKYNNRAPIVTIRAAQNNKGQFNLQYIICIQKPRKVAVITDISEKRSNHFTVAGWRFFTKKEWDKANKSFEIVLVEEQLCDDNFKIQAPDRIVSLPKSEIDIILNASQKNETIGGVTHSNFDKGYAYLWNLLLTKRDRISKNYYLIENNTFIIDTQVKIKDVICIEDGKAYNDLQGENVKTSKQKTFKYLANDKVRVYFDVGQAHKAVNLFRTHHGSDSGASLNDYYASKFQIDSGEGPGKYVDTTFVEGITGHNSTDRLIRNKNIDDIWYYKQMNAIRTKIALFDERIFKKITDLNDDEILKVLITNPEDKITTTEKTTVLTQKGIYVFNIIENKSASAPEFLIVGVEDVTKNETLSIETKAKAKLLGRITKSDGKDAINIKFVNQDEHYFDKEHIFDYMTIHQGLLDKLYNKLGASNRRTEVTDILQNTIIKHPENNGLVIHSGRSRPSLNDMPQKVPFIQFSAIDSAVLDSKYTFVELLNFAYYEKNNS